MDNKSMPIYSFTLWHLQICINCYIYPLSIVKRNIFIRLLITQAINSWTQPISSIIPHAIAEILIKTISCSLKQILYVFGKYLIWYICIFLFKIQFVGYSCCVNCSWNDRFQRRKKEKRFNRKPFLNAYMPAFIKWISLKRQTPLCLSAILAYRWPKSMPQSNCTFLEMHLSKAMWVYCQCFKSTGITLHFCLFPFTLALLHSWWAGKLFFKVFK